MQINRAKSKLPEPHNHPRTTRDLTTAQRLLLELILKNQFGRIENVPVRAGQPVLDCGVRVVRTAHLGQESSETKLPRADEFELKKAVTDLLDELASLVNGTVVRLEFRHGLPCLLETTNAVGARLASST
jgi:hypothetical protein